MKDEKLLAELERIFNPRGVVVVGASNKGGNIGRFFLDGFIQLGFKNLYVVHPKEKEVQGIKTYGTVGEIPGEVDLAVVFSPHKTVPQVVRECALKGIKGVVICTSGFGEKDSEGLRLEQEVMDIARRNGTRLIGPNCVGIYCPSSRLANFGFVPKESGPAGMISQSGSLSIMFVVAEAARGINFSKVISCGNECDLNAADFLAYLGQDPETEIIISYLEGVRDARRFCQIAREVSKEKPIIVWKGGTTEVGARAAATHTGALAGDADIWKAAVAQSGMISTNSADELLDCLEAFYFLPLPRGRRVAIVTSMGGLGVTIADACIECGLEVAELSARTRRRLEEFISPIGTCTNNPVDLGMLSIFNPQMYIDAIEALGKDDNVDMLIITSGSWKSDYIQSVLDVAGGVGKPIVFVTLQALKTVMEEPLPTRGIAFYPDGRRAVVALSKMVAYQRFRAGD